MAETKTTTPPTPTHESDVVIQKAKGFWAQYSKPITYIGGAIILIIGGWYGYQNFIKLPKEKSANDAIYAAEAIFDKMGSTAFSKDSVDLVLKGGNTPDGKKITGLLKVISSYGGTESGNRAKYMAGASYLQMKDFDNAIKLLKEFDAHGATQIQMAAYRMLGDAYSEKKNIDEALSYYKKAATVNEKDEAFTGDALMRAASYAQAMGKNTEAIDLYKKLKNNFPTNSSVTSGEVDKQLASLGQLDSN
ncbi:MAG: tetratricopeptide repeat protein [Ferruginibacter sp.]